MELLCLTGKDIHGTMHIRCVMDVPGDGQRTKRPGPLTCFLSQPKNERDNNILVTIDLSDMVYSCWILNLPGQSTYFQYLSVTLFYKSIFIIFQIIVPRSRFS